MVNFGHLMTIDDCLNSALLAEVEPLLGFLIAVEPVSEEVMGGLGDSSPPLLAPPVEVTLKRLREIEL